MRILLIDVVTYGSTIFMWRILRTMVCAVYNTAVSKHPSFNYVGHQ